MIEPAIPLNDGSQPEAEQGRDWVSIAEAAYTSSTNYMDANWRKQWEDNIAMFQSRHPAGSKYNSDAYKSRSRLFRPKTRSLVRKNEAAAAVAFFSNPDVVSIEAENEADPRQVVSAEINQHLLNYRLQKTLPWFKLLVGALQTAQVIGIVCSYQYWHYKERVTVYQQAETDDLGNVLMDAAGQAVLRDVEDVQVLKDEPCVALLPPEQYRFDPACDWMDPVGTSPYFVRLVPMTVMDVREMMQRDDRKTGQPRWREYADAEIRVAMHELDSLRSARENKRQDPLTNTEQPLGDFEIVWCHENFVRIDGEELVYWTLGTTHLLTDPAPLEQVYFTGQRPFVIGVCTLEANRVVPDSLVQMGSALQRETNDTINQRRDNVSLVLNKRYIVARGKDVDVQSLVRNVAGGVTMANGTEDVKALEWSDVTGSSYQEQDRLNVDFDELTGNFSSSSVMTNRKLNETVGGMNLLSGGASQLTEYLLRTFVETWVEPVLAQLVKLEQAYETDTVLLGLIGQKARDTLQHYGIDQITDDLLNQDLTVRVNVGMGATDPQTKLAKFTHAMSTYAQIAGSMPDVDREAVRKELFGLVGYRDGARFFQKGDDGNTQALQQAQQIIQQLQQELQRMRGDKAAEMADKFASADLKQAQTVKTLAEAGAVVTPQLMQRAVTPEMYGPAQPAVR